MLIAKFTFTVVASNICIHKKKVGKIMQVSFGSKLIFQSDKTNPYAFVSDLKKKYREEYNVSDNEVSSIPFRESNKCGFVTGDDAKIFLTYMRTRDCRNEVYFIDEFAEKFMKDAPIIDLDA